MTVPTDPHTLASTTDPSTLAHALVARLAIDGRRDDAEALASLFKDKGITTADDLPGTPPNPHHDPAT